MTQEEDLSIGEKIIAVDGLEKQYTRSPVKAVGGISFAVERGEVFGLLGPNGAGKNDDHRRAYYAGAAD
jgi:ABC-type uncharacterized transport system ATPase subunit